MELKQFGSSEWIDKGTTQIDVKTGEKSVPRVVKTRIVKIGNSRGIRIPKHWLEQSHLSEEVELELHANRIVIRSAYPVRHNWETAFQVMAAVGDDEPLDGDTAISTSCEDTEWEW